MSASVTAVLERPQELIRPVLRTALEVLDAPALQQPTLVVRYMAALDELGKAADLMVWRQEAHGYDCDCTICASVAAEFVVGVHKAAGLIRQLREVAR